MGLIYSYLCPIKMRSTITIKNPFGLRLYVIRTSKDSRHFLSRKIRLSGKRCVNSSYFIEQTGKKKAANFTCLRMEPYSWMSLSSMVMP